MTRVLDEVAASREGDIGQASRTMAEDIERVLSSRIVNCLRVVEDELRDLATFIPLWLSNIEKRRALMLRPKEDGADDADQEKTT